jgi:replicative DNA helicase
MIVENKVSTKNAGLYLGYLAGVEKLSEDYSSSILLNELKDASYIDKLDTVIVDLVGALEEKDVGTIKDIVLSASNMIVEHDMNIVDMSDTEFSPESNTRYSSYIEGDSDLSNLIIYAGDSGTGKSQILLNQTLDIYTKYDVPCLFLNLEMPKSVIDARIIAQVYDLDFNDVINSKGTKRAKYNKMLKDFFKDRAKFYILNSSTDEATVTQMIRLHHQKGFKVFAIDYLALVESSLGVEDGWKSLTRLTKHLHKLTIDLDILVLTAAQADISKDEDIHIRGAKELINSSTKFYTILQTIEDRRLKVARIKHIKNRTEELRTFILETAFDRSKFINTGAVI